MTIVRVLVADAHPIVREGLKALVAREPGMAVVGEAADAAAVLALASALDPCVVVLGDLAEPAGDGPGVVARLRQAGGRRVLALTAREDPTYLRQLRAAGAAGVAPKCSPAAELVRAIGAVAASGAYPAAVDDLACGRQPPEAGLSPRGVEVLRLVALGYANKEIAARLGLSVKTVETHKARSMEKLGLRGRVDLVRYAAGRGWLGDGVAGTDGPSRVSGTSGMTWPPEEPAPESGGAGLPGKSPMTRPQHLGRPSPA